MMMYFGKAGGGRICMEDLSKTFEDLGCSRPDAMAYLTPGRDVVGVILPRPEMERLRCALHTTGYVEMPESYTPVMANRPAASL
jgi:hypothetical protein